MKNSEEILDKIKQIPDLDREITIEVVKQDLKLARKSESLKKLLENIIDGNVNYNDSKTVDELVENYMNMTPYMGYCQNYWKTKKEILKERYNIEWLSPIEENPNEIYD